MSLIPKNILFQGILITHYMKPSSDQCLSACKAEKECSHFSFNPENGLCLLYQECINFDYGDPDYVSGNVICDYQNITCNTLYNAILRIVRNFLETKGNIKISTHPFYHINLD